VEVQKMMRNRKIYCIFSLAILLLLPLTSCRRNETVITRTDTTTSGEALIAADECLEPVVKEEIDVFTRLNLDAHITPVFASEQDVFNFLMTDSIRLIIAARDITEVEKQHLKKLKRQPRSQKIAIDGIALIINKENMDSLLSVRDLQKILTGEIQDWNAISSSKTGERPITVVFDQQNSSTLRFMNDSICKGKQLSSKAVAAKSNQEVIRYVATHPNAMGVIGVNWISNPNDSTKLSFDNIIRVVSLSREIYPTEDNSYKPFPAYLATGDYPLRRDIYVIISDVRGGLPAGFVSFIAGDSGQRIILKAGLVPATRPTRLINLKNEF
jgi:phosphate transport system substrate-binding protein